MIKKLLLLACIFTLLSSPALAVTTEHIYKGDSMEQEDILFTYSASKFYLGENTENEPILTHSAHAVYLGDTKDEYLWRMNGGKLHKGSAFARTDVVATMLNNKIYAGYVMSEEEVENVTPLFTLVENKIYKGDSTLPEDCLLTFSGVLSDDRLVFIAYELSQPKYQLQLNRIK